MSEEMTFEKWLETIDPDISEYINEEVDVYDACEYAFNDGRKSARAEAQKVEKQEGMVTVPVEPTHEMIVTAFFNGDESLALGHAAIYEECVQKYKAMIKAAQGEGL